MKVLDALRAHAQDRPEHAAIWVGADDDRTISYGELVVRMDAIAKELVAAGVRPGERCGLRAQQGERFVENALAILAAGACLVPIPEDTDGEALVDATRECALHHLVEAVPDRTITPLEASCSEGVDEAAFRSVDPAYMRFTSGTTDQRKGVIVGADSIADRLDNANAHLEIGPEDRVLWLLPMAHHFLVSILLYLRFGATIVLPRSSLAKEVLALAVRSRATVFYASPYHYGLLAKDASGVGLPDVRLAVSTADGLRGDVAEAFQARFGFPLVQALGIIEVGLPVLNAASAATKPTALGRPAPGYEVWLRNEDGSERTRSSDDETGEICIRGRGLFDAYLRPFVRASDLLDRGSFRTGDQGWVDADGDLYLAGRRHNRINMAGMKFFCEEVEQALDCHPAVKGSRVFAQQHPHLGEIPAAEVVLVDAAQEPSRKEFVDHLKGRLARYKIPRFFTVVTDLEMTATGKVRRWAGSNRPAGEDTGSER